MNDKKTNYKKLLGTTLSKFLSYFVLIGFIFLSVIFFIKSSLPNVLDLKLSVCLSLITGILLFHIIHFICRSTTIETFKHDKLDLENTENFLKKMNLFFTICIIFSVIICIGYLFFDNFLFANAIQKAYTDYNFISPDYANTLVNNILDEYNETFVTKVFSTIICELSLVSSFISLIPYQEKMVKKYNV